MTNAPFEYDINPDWINYMENHDDYCNGIEEVAETIRERGKSYGTPYANHLEIARLWSVILDQEITPLMVVQCMLAVKLARLKQTEGHTDSWEDVIGYGGIGKGIAKVEYQLSEAKKKL